jgi:hypothetical protein
MGVGASLVFLAVGAILAFATRFELVGIDLQTIGWIFMAVGVAGLFFTFLFARPRRARGMTEIVDDPVYVQRDDAAHPHRDHTRRDQPRVHHIRHDRDPGF